MRTPLIIVSYHQPGTGFYRVISNVSVQLSPEYDISYVGIGYVGAILREDHWTLYPATDALGTGQVKSITNLLGPGIILIINDLWVIPAYREWSALLPPGWKYLAYIPIDGTVHGPSAFPGLDFLHGVVAYTAYGKGVLEPLFSVGSKRPSMYVIPHGIDQAFYPLVNRFDIVSYRAFRREALPTKIASWEDAFIVLNGNRFSHRKRLDLTLDAFLLLKKLTGEKVRLWLHQPHIREDEYTELNRLIDGRGLQEDVYISRFSGKVLDNEPLNILYNLCDVGINTSMGEGWGLVSFEHAATGAAQLVPGHSAPEELWTGAGLLVPVVARHPGIYGNGHLQSVVDAEAAGTLLASLYSDPVYLEETSNRCLGTAGNPRYDWTSIGADWKNLLNIIRS